MNSSGGKILIVDDEKMLRDSLAKWFRPSYECLTAPDGATALELIRANDDLLLVITDERMPQMTGTELLRKAKELKPELAFIMLTAYGSMELAVEAMRNGGADDFYQKPVTDMKAFELIVARAVEKAALKMEVSSLKREVTALKAESKAELENFTGKSPAMEKVYRQIRKVAPTAANVLIEGPSGTGKELVARALHDLSPRAKGPFIPVECAALPADLLEAELFGHEKGAFTGAIERKTGCFEAANGGTIFLDEIGEIPLAMQVKLLRVLESRVVNRIGNAIGIPVDFRLVAATNRNLLSMVHAGTFREDLYYRLNVIDIAMPALRDRPGDIALLAARFLKEFSQLYSSGVTGIEPEAMKALEDYPWPGNVRQLRNTIEKMVVLAGTPRLTLADIPVEIRTPASQPPILQTSQPPNLPASRPSASLTLADSEKQQILAAIEAAGGNKTKAAERLGISRRTLHRKLNEWKLNP